MYTNIINIMSNTQGVVSQSPEPVACERRRISVCRFSPLFFGGEKRQPEIRLRSQATEPEVHDIKCLTS